MMTEEEYQEFLEALRGLVVGATIVRVDPKTDMEHWFTLVAKREDGEEFRVEVCGNELGVWLRTDGLVGEGE